SEAAHQASDQIATIGEEVVPFRDQGKVQPPAPRKKWGRLLILLLLAFLLVGSGTFGALRVFNPCLLGVCPGLKLSTNEVDMTNSASQTVKITNTGSADLQWNIGLPPSFDASWLTYTPHNGTLLAGKSALITLTSNASQLQSGVNSTVLQVGGQGVNAQDIV